MRAEGLLLFAIFGRALTLRGFYHSWGGYGGVVYWERLRRLQGTGFVVMKKRIPQHIIYVMGMYAAQDHRPT